MRTLRTLFLLFTFVPLTTAACDGNGGGTTGGSGGTTSGGSGGTTGGSGGSTGGSGGATTGGSGGGIQASQCREDADCTGNGEYCAAPGSPSCGGAGCPGEACTVDADCQAVDPASICETDPCCGMLLCTAGCSAENPCAEGMTCNADSHCVPQSCVNSGCPLNFDCGAGADPSCARRSCSSDAECDGYCVLGACYGELGYCDLPKP